MLNIKVTLFIIAVSFVVFTQIQVNTAVGITYAQYLGARYLVGVANPLTKDPISCGWMSVIREGMDGKKYSAYYETWVNDGLYKLRSRGVFIDSVIHNEIPFRECANVNCTVEGFNNGLDLLIFPKPYYNSQVGLLVSRNVIPSDEAKIAFEERAANLRVNISYVDHKNCSYRLHNQWL